MYSDPFMIREELDANFEAAYKPSFDRKLNFFSPYNAGTEEALGSLDKKTGPGPDD